MPFRRYNPEHLWHPWTSLRQPPSLSSSFTISPTQPLFLVATEQHQFFPMSSIFSKSLSYSIFGPVFWAEVSDMFVFFFKAFTALPFQPTDKESGLVHLNNKLPPLFCRCHLACLNFSGRPAIFSKHEGEKMRGA